MLKGTGHDELDPGTARGASTALPRLLLGGRGHVRRSLLGRITLLLTNATGLYEVYQDNLPRVDRERFNCSRCRAFMSRYGALVTVDSEVHAQSVLWDPESVPDLFADAIAARAEAVQSAPVVAAHVDSNAVWGRPSAGGYPHMAVHPGTSLVHHHPVDSPESTAAQISQNQVTLRRALARYPEPLVKQAVRLLRERSLHRSEKVLGAAQWFLDVHGRADRARSTRERSNQIWSSAAAAPPGFCNVSTTMLGVLLDDLASQRGYQSVRRTFEARMDPAKYQRPQAAPSAGNIAAAERLMEQLKAGSALRRRYATLDDLQTLWRPAAPPAERAGGLFGHLRPKGSTVVEELWTPPVTITWEKFRRTVVPGATAMKLNVGTTPRNFGALTTAAVEDATAILQWDNPVAFYVYRKGSLPQDWALDAGTEVNVRALTLLPHLWTDEEAYPHQGRGVFFLLEGAHDTKSQSVGLCLFPETLRAEFRPIRATLEAFSKKAHLEEVDHPAAGLLLSERTANTTWAALVTVDSPHGRTRYQLDRWD